MLNDCAADISKMGQLFASHERKLLLYTPYCQNKRASDYILNEQRFPYLEVKYIDVSTGVGVTRQACPEIIRPTLWPIQLGTEPKPHWTPSLFLSLKLACSM